MNGSESDFYHDDPLDLIEASAKKKMPSFLALLLLVLVGTFFIQTTLAQNVSLNSGNPIEFGQGISATTACSGSTQLTITPSAAFTNAANAGSFKFESFTVSGIPVQCHGSDFTINAFGNTDAAPLALFNSTATNVVVYNNAGTFESGVGSSGISVSGSAGRFTVVFSAPVAQSSSIFKITIQSGPHTIPSCSQGGSCIVGSVGPGGGRVFYVASTPFTCGANLTSSCSYLEAAPTTGASAWSDGNFYWSGSTSTRVGTTGTAIGTGLANTNAIVSQSNTAGRAATGSQAYRGPNNLTDWFLPSKDELNQMCKWARGLPWTSDSTLCSSGGLLNSGIGAQGFGAAAYWSSSEPSVASNAAWSQGFTNGTQYDSTTKSSTYWVRPIRAF
ncbi:unannotated protein [freshwater metagenome]|uniref:Unannotated protein n=1 Tax=freshwater metagenome TaxID=449393 RepID=A0A6J5ZMS9_9ZZZZ|nr:DUF1566 domain-containing protein [Actinomycetota bacterium]